MSAALCRNALSIRSYLIFASNSIIIFISSSVRVNLFLSSPNLQIYFDTEGSAASLIEENGDVGLETFFRLGNEETDF
jgi:hypothetical protein